MKKILEKLWYEYLEEECSVIENEEERNLVKRAGAMHKSINELLSLEQSEVLEKYIETLYEMQAAFVKKSFLKGCSFATAILFEFSIFEKNNY